MKRVAVLLTILASLSFAAAIAFFTLAIWGGDQRFSMMGTMGAFVTIILALIMAISWAVVDE